MNILIKLMSIVSLVIAPHIARPDGERSVAPVPLHERVEIAQPHVRFVQGSVETVETLLLKTLW